MQANQDIENTTITNPKDAQAVGHREDEVARQQNVKTEKHQRVKATFYLDPQDVVAIDRMQTEAFKETGKKPERSNIVSEAIQYLFRLRNSELLSGYSQRD